MGTDEAIRVVFEVLEYLTSHKEEYDFNKIVQCGFSAGAHLACDVWYFLPKRAWMQ